MSIPLLFLLFIGAVIAVKKVWSKDKWITPDKKFPTPWRITLLRKVGFYNGLTEEGKKRFEFKVQEFLLNVRITGIDTTINETDKLLVAASAVIPIFEFPNWKYTNLFEVLLYPSMFDEDFKTEGEERSILGMVGSGYMSGKMILSKPALERGFEVESDKRNTAIHEFVHLIDKADGVTDGIPNVFLEKQYTIPWVDMINKEIESIYEGESDINPYGGTNKAEFFAVASEYFFERPKLLADKHPELYNLMEKVFNSDMDERELKKKKHSIGRNDDCPCDSGKKFKQCCGKNHY